MITLEQDECNTDNAKIHTDNIKIYILVAFIGDNLFTIKATDVPKIGIFKYWILPQRLTKKHIKHITKHFISSKEQTHFVSE